jgi:8-oxo-dGTP pyrophosphatase MutT (NUDIX family)
VSGYVEPGETPIETAFKELAEEVGVSPEQVSLVREGPVLVLEDPPTGTIWAVHPFLFEDLGVEVVTDWEHMEHRWIEPAELGSLDTVPKLDETLRAAMGDPGKEEK